MATKKELEFVLKAVADGRGLEQINQDIVKTIFNARQLSQQQYNIVVKMLEEGKNLNQISAELRQLQADERAVARTAREAETAHANWAGKMQSLQLALGSLGLGVSIQQGIEFGKQLINQARSANDAKGVLTAAAGGIATYSEAMQAAQQVTQGMVSRTELANSLTTIYGSKLATSAQEAAELAAAGSVLTGVFDSAGASMDLYVRLLNSGSKELFNNFGLSQQLVDQLQAQIEATTDLTGQEARLAAIREGLKQTAQQYQGALSDDTRAVRQFEAASKDLQAALGQIILPTVTESMSNFGTVARGGADSLDEMPPAAQAAAQGIIDLISPITTVNALIRQYQEATGNSAAAADEAAAAAQNLAAAADDVIAGMGPVVSSLDAMGFSSAGAAEALDPLIKKMTEANFRAREAAAAFAQSAAAMQSQSLAGAFGGQQDDFSQQLTIARLRETGQQRLDYQRQQAQQEQRQQQEAAKQSEQIVKQQASAMTKAFDQVGQEIGNAVSGAISANNQDVIGKLLGVENAEQNAGEAVRRMAAVAAGGIQNEWAASLATQLTGVNDATAQAFVQAFSSGNEGALKASAQKLALNPIVDMFDANLIAQQFEQKMRAQQLKQQLDDKVNALLGERGIQAVAAASGQVGQLAVDATAATSQIGQGVAQLGPTAEQAAKSITDGFKGAVPALDTLHQRLRLIVGDLTEIIQSAGLASGNIQAMNLARRAWLTQHGKQKSRGAKSDVSYPAWGRN